MRKTTAQFAVVATVAALALTGCSKKDDKGTDPSAAGTGGTADVCKTADGDGPKRSEEHTSELQSH